MGEFLFEAKGYICERCSHRWYPKNQDFLPAVCPKCKSPYWNRKRRKKDNSKNVRFSGDSRGHENTIPPKLSAKEIAKKTIEENQLVFDRLANV
jgi:hypothetical protein